MIQGELTNPQRRAPLRVAASGLAFCFLLGIAGGFLTAEFGQGFALNPSGLAFAVVGLTFAVGLPILPVRVAKRVNMGVPALLSYCAGFEALVLWISRSALFPPSSETFENRGGAIAFVAILMALGLTMALMALLPAVRGRQQ